MAQSVPQEASQPGFATEFERLAGRAPTGAEVEVGTRLSTGERARSVWAEGFLPEGLAHLALALASAERRSVLFISPNADLLEQRQLRLGQRTACVLLQEVVQEKRVEEGLLAWTTPNCLDAAHLTRAFGRTGPELIVVEEAQATLSTGFHHRPSLRNLKGLIERFPRADVIAAAPARGDHVRAAVGKAWGVKAFVGKKGATATVAETLLSGPSGPILRVEKEEADAIAAVIGPLPRPAVVLCSTPAQADQVYAHLEAEQVPVHRFHSGLAASERAKELVHFALPGRRAVMVAVSSFGPNSGFAGESVGAVPDAFGHGYARQDLRSLVHLCAPCSLDQYAKELALLSRGSEDEQRPVALMLYNPAHLALNLALLKRKRPTPEVLDVVVDGLMSAPGDQWFDESQLDPMGGTSPKALSLALSFLADLGIVERSPTGANSTQGSSAQRSGHAPNRSGAKVRTRTGVKELKAAAKALAAAFEELNAGDAPRLEEVEEYALAEECRAVALSRLLGFQEPEACGSCDVCDPSGEMELSGVTKARAVQAPTIETRPTKRRPPIRRKSNDKTAIEMETFVSDLDAMDG